MNTTGTAIHCSTSAATKAITTKIILDKLFFNVKSLNFNAIMGRLLTINQDKKIIIAYNTHLFNNTFTTMSVGECQYIKGKDAINIPTAGVGTPLNPYDCEESILNFAKR